MKTLSTEHIATLISKAIDAMATGKKTTALYRSIHLVVAGVLLGNVLDVKGTVAQLSKLPSLIPIIESHGEELKELRRLRDQDHRSIEEIRAILQRNKIGASGPDSTDISTAQYSE